MAIVTEVTIIMSTIIAIRKKSKISTAHMPTMITMASMTTANQSDKTLMMITRILKEMT